MTINYTTLLGLTEPVTGTQSGTWGSDINTGLTDYVEAAIAGAQVISGSQTAVTLSVTTGSSSAPTTLSQAGSGATGSSQYQIIRCTGNPAGLLTITAPASDKTYVVINATSTSQAVKIVGAGPTTGVTIVSGERAFVAWNGSDFVKVGGAAGGSNTQVQYNNNGVFGGVSGATTNGTAITFSTTNLKLQGSSTGVSSFASANSGATDYTITFPAASTTIPVATQTLTFSGPTAARTITLPDANFTAARTDSAQTFTGVQTFSSNPILSGGTANGVLYLNGSSVATSGSALTFDGTTFQYTGAANFATSSGNVGIGTSSPSAKLQVVNGNILLSNAYYLSARNNANTTSISLIGRNTSDQVVIDADGYGTLIGSGGALNLNSSGNLGVGVTPGTWSDGKVIEINTAGNALWGEGNFTVLLQNARYNGGYKYARTGVASSHYDLEGGSHKWYNAPSGTAGNAITFTQAMTLDASGNLLVGDTSVGSASDRLGIVGGNIRVIKSTAYAANPLDTTSFSGAILVNSNNGSGDLTGLAMYVNSSYGAGCGIFAKQTASTTADLLFYTGTGVAASNVERARITSGGDLLVGKTSSSSTSLGFEVRSTGDVFNGLSASANATSTLNVYSTGAGAYRFYVGMGGTIYATSTTITAISDQRLKENIQDIDVGLNAVMALKPRKFDWKEGKGKDKKGDRGWIAQEFEQVFPDMIDTWRDPAPEGEEPYKAVNADLIPVLVKAIQEQQALITSLTARVAALEGTQP